MLTGAKRADWGVVGCEKIKSGLSLWHLLCRLSLSDADQQAVSQAGKAAYPAMAPLDQYRISDEKSEIALARSAAPGSISDGAEVMVLGREGYKIAVKGTNGFLCIVERSWGQSTDQAEFWNPKIRAPHCFNAQAATSFAPIYLMKTRLVLAGKSKAEIAQAISHSGWTPRLASIIISAHCWMLSKGGKRVGGRVPSFWWQLYHTAWQWQLYRGAPIHKPLRVTESWSYSCPG